MIFNNFYEGLYLKSLVNIIVGSSKTIVYIEMLNKSGLVDSHEEEFDTKCVSAEMYEYIQSSIKETPYFYISILDNARSQGALPTCAQHKTRSFYDLSASEYKCYKNKWTYYTSKKDISEIQRVYKKIGVDFIFSPFLILANFFKDKISTHLAMFVLIQEGALSLSIFENSNLLFAKHIDMEVEVLGDTLVVDDNNSINQDYQRFSIIQSAVNYFYQSEKFESKFIENIYLGDTVGVSEDLKKYLEEEMFLNVYIRHASLAAELCEITKMELS